MEDQGRIKEKSTFHGKKAIILGSLLLCLMLVTIIGTTYAVFVVNLKGNEKNQVSTGTLSVDFQGKNNAIALTNAYPMDDTKGLQLEGFQFSIENTGTLPANYRIKLEEGENSNFPREYLKFVFYQEGEENITPALLSTLPSGLVLREGSNLAPSAKLDFVLKLWIDESAGNDVQGKTFQGKIVVESVQTSETIADTVSPMIQLNDEYVININQGADFVDPGVKSITDNSDGTIDTSQISKTYNYFDGTETVSVDSVDTSKIGAYTIYYRASDTAGNVGLTIRVVNVIAVNTVPPTIYADQLSFCQDQEYPGITYSAFDSLGNNISNRVTIVDTVNPDVVGSYSPILYAVDKDGNVSGTTVAVTVLPACGGGPDTPLG